MHRRRPMRDEGTRPQKRARSRRRSPSRRRSVSEKRNRRRSRSRRHSQTERRSPLANPSRRADEQPRCRGRNDQIERESSPKPKLRPRPPNHSPQLRPRPPNHSPPRINPFELLQDNEQVELEEDKAAPSNPWRRDQKKYRARRLQQQKKSDAREEEEEEAVKEEEEEEEEETRQEEEAELAIEEIMTVPQSALEQIMVGMKEIENTTSTSINMISSINNNDVEREIRIKGMLECVAKARDLITEKIVEESSKLAKQEDSIQNDLLEETIDVPKRMVGPLIGKGGHRLKSFREDSGADIEVVGSQVRVRGDADSIVRAITLISEAMDELGGDKVAEDAVEHSFEISRDKVGRLIGRGGENKKQLESDNSVKIEFKDTFESVTCVTIHGLSANVTRVTDLINEQIDDLAVPQQAAVIEETMDVPPNLVGHIMGKGGSTVQRLRAECGAKISADRDIPGTLRLSGTIESVALARTMINDLLAEREEADTQKADVIEETMDVPPNLVGYILGKGGSTVQKLQDECGARIRADRASPSKMLLAGSIESVALARSKINALLAEREETDRKFESKAGSKERVEDVMDISPKLLRRIFGHAGNNIMRLQSESGAKIDVDRVHMTSVSLSGTRESVARAREMIIEWIEDGATHVEESMGVSPKVIETIFGNGGQTATRIQIETGADMEVDKVVEGSMVSIAFRGSKESVRRAQEMVSQLLKVSDAAHQIEQNVVSKNDHEDEGSTSKDRPKRVFRPTMLSQDASSKQSTLRNTQVFNIFTSSGTLPSVEADQQQFPSDGTSAAEVERSLEAEADQHAATSVWTRHENSEASLETDEQEKKQYSKHSMSAGTALTTEASSEVLASSEVDKRPRPSVKVAKEIVESKKRPKPTGSKNLGSGENLAGSLNAAECDQRPKPSTSTRIAARVPSAPSETSSDARTSAQDDERPKFSFLTPTAKTRTLSGAAESVGASLRQKLAVSKSITKASLPSNITAKPSQPSTGIASISQTSTSSSKPSLPSTSARKPTQPSTGTAKASQPSMSSAKPALPSTGVAKDLQTSTGSAKPSQPLAGIAKPSQPSTSISKPSQLSASSVNPPQPPPPPPRPQPRALQSSTSSAKPSQPKKFFI